MFYLRGQLVKKIVKRFPQTSGLRAMDSITHRLSLCKPYLGSRCARVLDWNQITCFLLYGESKVFSPTKN